MRQKYAKAISCLLAALLLTGCQTTPSSVKNKAKDYTNSKDVAVDKEEFVSVDHLLDNMDSLLKASYQNMILADTIHIEQPQSDRKSTRLNSSHRSQSRMPSSA